MFGIFWLTKWLLTSMRKLRVCICSVPPFFFFFLRKRSLCNCRNLLQRLFSKQIVLITEGLLDRDNKRAPTDPSLRSTLKLTVTPLPIFNYNCKDFVFSAKTLQVFLSVRGTKWVTLQKTAAHVPKVSHLLLPTHAICVFHLEVSFATFSSCWSHLISGNGNMSAVHFVK